MKTFEQCCDEVAKRKNYDDWLNVILVADISWFVRYEKEASEFYANEFAREKVKEAIDLARTIENCSDGIKYDAEFSDCKYTKQEILEKLKL